MRIRIGTEELYAAFVACKDSGWGADPVREISEAEWEDYERVRAEWEAWQDKLCELHLAD